MRAEIKCRLERTSTGSTLQIGLGFNYTPNENPIEILQKLVAQSFPGWYIASKEIRNESA